MVSEHHLMIEEGCSDGSLQHKTAQKAVYSIQEPEERVSAERVNLGKAVWLVVHTGTEKPGGRQS